MAKNSFYSQKISNFAPLFAKTPYYHAPFTFHPSP